MKSKIMKIIHAAFGSLIKVRESGSLTLPKINMNTIWLYSCNKEIPKNLLLQKSFIAALRLLCSCGEDGINGIPPEEYLIDHLLPLLEGTKRRSRDQN